MNENPVQERLSETVAPVLSNEEVRAIAARVAWRFMPHILAESDPITDEHIKPFFELIAVAIDPDRLIDLSASRFDALERAPFDQVIHTIASPRLTLDDIRRSIDANDPFGGIALSAIVDDVATLVELEGSGEAVMRAARLLEEPLWHDLQAGSWTEHAQMLKSRVASSGKSKEADLIDCITSGGEETWRGVWKYLKIRRPGSPEVPLWMLSDEPVSSTTDDLFGFGDYASAIAAFITDPRTGTPLTLAINGPWGCGKSSLARMIHRNLEQTLAEDQGHAHITCWFNAWMHDDAKDMAAAFASSVAQVADSHRSRWRKIISPLPTELLTGMRHTRRKVVRWGVLLFAVTLVGIFILQYGDEVSVEGLPSSLTNTQALATFLLGFGTLLLQIMQRIGESAKTVSAFVNDPNAVAQRGSLSQVRKQLQKLIDSATRGNRRFVIFVDDVERCRPPRAVDLLEVVNQLLAHQGVVTIVLADLPAVAAAAEIKYQDLVKVYAAQATANGKPTAAQSFGRLYLQKIIQLEFDIPAHRRSSIHTFITGVGREREEHAPMMQPPPVRKDLKSRALRLVSFTRAERETRSSISRARAWVTRRFVWLIIVPAILFATLLGTTSFIATNPMLTIAVWPAYIILLMVGGVELQGFINRRMDRRRAKRLRDLIDRKFGEGVRTSSGLRSAMAREADADSKELNQLISERLIRKVTASDSDVWNAAVEEATRWVPPFPRHAKRLINRMRLLLGIVLSRDGFSENAVEGARAVGKWVVLWERWPEISQQALRDPEWISELEAAAARDARDSFDAAVSTSAAQYKGDEDLLAFFKSSPKLGGLIDRIVHLGHGV